VPNAFRSKTHSARGPLEKSTCEPKVPSGDSLLRSRERTTGYAVRVVSQHRSAPMAKSTDEWRALAITAALGTHVLLLAAWLTGMFSAPPETLP
jgi:hypothetical protein